MTKILKPYFVFCVALCVAACGGGSGGGMMPTPTTPGAPFPAGVEAGGSGNAGETISGFGTTASSTPTPHQGLEAITTTPGTATVLGTVTVENSPSLSFGRTTTGFDAVLSGSPAARYDTRPGSRNIAGQNRYTTCAANCGTATEIIAVTTFTGGTATDLSASTYGTMKLSPPSGSNMNTRYAVFSTGLPTVASNLPITATATYTGAATGFVIAPLGIAGLDLEFTGRISLTADFAARTIDGKVSAITARVLTSTPTTDALNLRNYGNGALVGLSDVIFNNGKLSGVTFSGTTIAGGPDGQFAGTFYGSDGGEIAGSFSSSQAFPGGGEVSGGRLIGSFGARRLVAGNDSGGSYGPSGPLSTFFFTQSTFNVAAHRGVEIIRRSSGLSPLAEPGLSFTRTTTGFTMALSQGNVSFDTRSGSAQAGNFYRYESCVDACTGASPIRVMTNFSTNPGLDYVTYGDWTVTTQSGLLDYGVFATGLTSTPAQLPTSGSATYVGEALGKIVTAAQTNGTEFNGEAIVTANFANRTITGTIANITVPNSNPSGAIAFLGDIQFTKGTFSGATFSGATAPTLVAGATVDLTAAVGQFGGAFYGPAAEQVGGSFTLANSTVGLIGAFGAKSPPIGVGVVSAQLPTDPLGRLTSRLQFNPTSHLGLELVEATDSQPLPILRANASLVLERTTTGFEMIIDGSRVRFDTRGDLFATTGVYTACYEDPSCASNSLSKQPYTVRFNSPNAATLNYSTYGVWSRNRVSTPADSFGVFTVGVPTTTLQMPTTGTATYSGTASGYVVTASSNIEFNGNATLTSNFATRLTNGAVTNIALITSGPSATLGDITFRAGIISGTTFTGQAVGNAGGTGSTININGVAGQYGGEFYGPAAAEAGGSFALPGSGFTVIGAFGTKR